MARITVEDCKKIVTNRFHLVVIAAHRAKELSLGAEPLVKVEGDKDTVIALREIADYKLNVNSIIKEIVSKQRRFYKSSSNDENLDKEYQSDTIEQGLDEEIASLFNSEKIEQEGFAANNMAKEENKGKSIDVTYKDIENED